MAKADQGRITGAALEYARLGWPVFPLHGASQRRCTCARTTCDSPGKHPLTKHGHKDATTDRELILRSWGQSSTANIGIVTGQASGLVALDVDPDKGGDESLADLEREYGRLPATPEQITGGGGRHILFAHPGGELRNRVGMAPGLDVRADGGYIVAAPSVHVSGRTYQWEASSHPNEVALAPMPAWLVERLTARPRNNGTGERPTVAETLAGVPEGQRDDSLFRMACTLRRADVPREWANRLVVDAGTNCSPPFPESKARAKVESAYSRYAPRDDASNLTSNHRVGSLEVKLKEVNAAELQQAGRERGVDLLPYLPLLGEPGFVVEGWSHIVASYPKVGKTELLATLAAQWHGRKILYITEEPQSVWEARLAKRSESFEHVQLCFGLGAGPGELLGRIAEGDEPIVIVDTVRNLLDLRDETNNSEVARALNPLIDVARRGSKTIIFLHHDRKGGGEHGEAIAGGHAFLGVVDVALEIRRDSQAPRRRLVRGWARVIEVRDLVYEMADDGSLAALGDPKALELESVKDRAADLLPAEWMKTSEVLALFGEPKPSQEQLRQALTGLAEDGRAEREPPITEGAQQGKTYRWRNLTSNGPPIGLEVKSGPDCKSAGGHLLRALEEYGFPVIDSDDPRNQEHA